MFRRGFLLWLLVGVALMLAWPVGCRAVAPPARPLVDLYGDPLPSGAFARLGTVRLRHLASVQSVLFSLDGKTLISSGSQSSLGDGQEAVHFWDVRTGRRIRALRGQPFGPADLDLSPDGRLLAAVSNGADCVWVWDLRAGTAVHKFTHDGESNHIAAAFGKSGKTLLITGAFHVELRDLRTGKRVWHITQGGWSPSVSPSGDHFALVKGEVVRVHDMATGKEVWRFAPKEPAFVAGRVAFSPSGTVLASGGMSGTVHLLEPATGKVVRQLLGHRARIEALAFSADGKLLASGDDDGEVRLWHVQTGKAYRRLAGHLSTVSSLRFSPDGRMLASGSSDYSIRLWDVSAGKELLPANGHQSFVETLAFSRDGRVLVSGGCDDGIIEWDVSSGRQKRRLAGKGDVLTAVAFSPDQRTLVSAGWGGVIRE
jgi:WD40 repeat protein